MAGKISMINGINGINNASQPLRQVQGARILNKSKYLNIPQYQFPRNDLKCESLNQAKVNNRLTGINFCGKSISEEQIYEIAKLINNEGVLKFPEHANFLKKSFSDLPGKLIGRPKSVDSIFSKLHNKKEILIGSQPEIIQIAKGTITDLEAFSFILENGSPQEADKVSKKIISLVKQGEIIPLDIINSGKYPYFQKDSLSKMVNSGFKLNTYQIPNGFPAAFLSFKLKDNSRIELQIRGPEVNEQITKQHPIYNFLNKKRCPDHDQTTQELYAVLRKLGAEDINDYKKYMARCFEYCREKELGIITEKPVLSDKFDKILHCLV